MKKFLFYLSICSLLSFQTIKGALSNATNVAAGPCLLSSSWAGGFSGYLGANVSLQNNSSLIGQNAVSIFSYRQNDDTELYEIKINPLVDEKAYVNFFKPIKKDSEMSSAPKTEDKKSNPIYGKSIDYLVLGDAPIVVIDQDTTDEILGDTQKICLIEAKDTVRTNKVKIKDAGGNDSSKIATIAAASGTIFAAVAPNGNSFGTLNSGIAVLYLDKGYLNIADAVAGTKNNNKAIGIGLGATNNLIAITQDAALDNIVSMQWDSETKNLFIALKAKRSNSASVGGAISVISAYFSTDATLENPYKLTLEPVVTSNSSNFTLNANNEIVGFYTNSANEIWSAIYKLKILKTSTSKRYMIVNGGVIDTTAAPTALAKNKVFALPMVNNKIANKNDLTKVVSTAAEMTRATDAAAIVGAGDLPIAANVAIGDMFTFGDSVYVCLTGDSAAVDEPSKQGIFYSSAIFNKDGVIAKWTPWQRVCGSSQKIVTAVIDPTSSLFAYLSVDTAGANSMNVTQWGSGQGDGILGGSTADGSNGFVSLMSNEFNIAFGGVSEIFNFDENSPTFKSGANGLSFLAVSGYQKLLLVETGRNVAGAFLPNSGDFTTGLLRSTNGYAVDGDANSKVMAIAGGDLTNLGPISKVEISRNVLAGGTNNGWLFVSGYNGVAVLSEVNGNGWDTATGLQRGFVGITSTMSFKEIGNFSRVRTVICDDTNLYILTADSLYKIALDAANFSTVGAPSPTVTLLATAVGLTGKSYASFNDFIVSSKLGLLATSEGIFRVGDGKNIKTGVSASDLNWTEIKLDYSGGYSSSYSSAKQLFPLSATKGGFTQGGNLYLLVCDYSRRLADIYRFEVQDTSGAAIVSYSTVQKIVEAGNFKQFLSIGNYRGNIFTDGSFLFHELSQNFGSRDFVKIMQHQLNMTSYGTSRGFSIDVGVPSDAYSVGIASRNSACGSYMVPGDFGVRVNE
ncbi:TPA: hypothetical protein DEO28_04250 [Candidatus Dependentiae bacterium]|nr:hypothetical protein [Candidatus Dependentiae bacterium]